MRTLQYSLVLLCSTYIQPRLTTDRADIITMTMIVEITLANLSAAQMKCEALTHDQIGHEASVHNYIMKR